MPEEGRLPHLDWSKFFKLRHYLALLSLGDATYCKVFSERFHFSNSKGGSEYGQQRSIGFL